MILKDKYEREYEPKYTYEHGWTPYISPVDKFRFGISHKEDGINYSVADSESFEVAEEKVYKAYQKILTCNHEWERWLPHANTGICRSCGIMKREMYTALETCNADGCKEPGEVSMTFKKMSKKFCMKHYMEAIIEQGNYFKYEASISEDHNDRMLSHCYVMDAEFVSLLKQSETFMSFNEKKQREILEIISQNNTWLINNFVIELNENAPVNLGLLWEFQYSIPLTDLYIVAQKWFEYTIEDPIEGMEEITKEIYEKIKNELNSLDLKTLKELFEDKKEFLK